MFHLERITAPRSFTLRIAFLSSSAGYVAGGIESTTLHFAETLSRRHHVSLVVGRARRSPAPTALAGLDFIDVPVASRFGFATRWLASQGGPVNPYFIESLSFLASLSVNPRCRTAVSDADVVSLHSKFDSMLLSRWARTLGTPSVFHIQGSRFGRIFRTVDCSRRYVAVSERSRLDLQERFGLSIPAAVPPGVGPELLEAHRAEDNILLFVGRLQPSKGVEDVLRIFSSITDIFPELKLFVLGDGPSRSSLVKLAQTLGIASRSRFLGAVRHPDIARFYARAKLLVFPTRSEVYPMVPLEALAAGCPVLASDIPGVVDSTGGNAMLLPPDDLAQWISAATKLLRDDALRGELSRKGRVWAGAHTWDTAAASYEKELMAAASAA